MTPEEIREIVNNKVALAKEQLRAEYEQKYANAVQELETQLRNAKADLLYIERRADAHRESQIRGKGQMHTDGSLSKEDYVAVLPAKLEMTSLEDLLKAQAAAAGIDPRNTEAFAVYHQIDERSINSYMAKRARGES